MTEEQVTKFFLRELSAHGWQIVTFDFPQSGTGTQLHPDGSTSKTEGILIPDIVAVKGHICTYWENKNRTYLPDFLKIEAVRLHNDYTEAFARLLEGFSIGKMYCGIGLPAKTVTRNAIQHQAMTDFVFGIRDGAAVPVYDPHGLFASLFGSPEK